MKRLRLPPKERALATELTYGVLRHGIRLDATATALADGGDIDPLSRRIVRLGLYQLHFLIRIPERAAVHATVGLAPPNRRAMVNALLRRFGREGRKLAAPADKADPVDKIALLQSQPRWFAQRMVALLGVREADRALDALNRNLGVHLRSEGDREALLRALGRDGHAARCGELAESALRMDTFPFVGRDRLFRQGRYTSQDEAGQAVALLCPVKPGMRVLDLCAAPGHKATALARMVGPEGRVVALDLQPTRLRQVAEEARRLGLINIATKAIDSTDRSALAHFLGKTDFDLVLVDAPCSGLGTLSKAPEIKLRRSEEDIVRLAGLQHQLLLNAADWVRPGGSLIYSVCTLTVEENQGAVERLLAERRDLAGAAFDRSGPPWDKMAAGPYAMRILPHWFMTEGFYVARLIRS